MEEQDQSSVTVSEMLLEDISSKLKDALDTVNSVASDRAGKPDLSSKGISLLQLKNHLMTQYMLDLTLIMKCKVTGQSIQDHPAIWRMIENRTYLEKIQPIETKLKYQIDKLIKANKFGETDESDALRFKPNLDNFAVKSDEDDDNDSDEDDIEDEDADGKTAKKNKGLYKAPKVAPMHYIGDDTAEDVQNKKMERLKRRALSSTMMEELRTEFMEEPEEIRESRDLHRHKEDRQRKERQEYEEQYFVRTAPTKKELHKSRKLATISSLDGLLKFDNLAHLDDDGLTGEPSAKRKKSSKGAKGKGKKGKGKKKKWRK